LEAKRCKKIDTSPFLILYLITSLAMLILLGILKKILFSSIEMNWAFSIASIIFFPIFCILIGYYRQKLVEENSEYIAFRIDKLKMLCFELLVLIGGFTLIYTFFTFTIFLFIMYIITTIVAVIVFWKYKFIISSNLGLILLYLLLSICLFLSFLVIVGCYYRIWERSAQEKELNKNYYDVDGDYDYGIVIGK